MAKSCRVTLDTEPNSTLLLCDAVQVDRASGEVTFQGLDSESARTLRRIGEVVVDAAWDYEVGSGLRGPAYSVRMALGYCPAAWQR